MAAYGKPTMDNLGTLKVSGPLGKSPGDDDMEAAADVNALMKAHEIKSDPKRHGRAKAHMKAKMAKMKSMVKAPNMKDDSTVGPDNDEAEGGYGV